MAVLPRLPAWAGGDAAGGRVPLAPVIGAASAPVKARKVTALPKVADGVTGQAGLVGAVAREFPCLCGGREPG